MQVSLDPETKEKIENQMDEVEDGTGSCLRECIINDSGLTWKFFYFIHSMMCVIIFSFAEIWQ